MQNKKEFIKSFFSKPVEDLHIVPIDLDLTGLTVCDILRNINKTFPENSRDRIAMKEGNKVVAIICRSELISPISGIVLLVGNTDLEINAESRSYVLISVDEKDIRTEERLDEINTDIIIYLAKLLRKRIATFDEFMAKSLYNDFEDLGE